MPLAEPERPRKMLPPPMTRASSTPMSSNPPISLQMVPTVSGSIPVFCSPARASPLSLSSTRLYLSSAICSALVEAGHAGCCFPVSSGTAERAFGRALFSIAKNIAISKYFSRGRPAGTRAGPPDKKHGAGRAAGRDKSRRHAGPAREARRPPHPGGLPRPPQAPPRPVRGAPSVPGGGPHLPGPGFCGIGKGPEPKPCADPARSPHARMHQPF